MSQNSSTTFSASANELQTKIYSNMSPAQKRAELYRLRETAWKLKLAGIKALHPNWSDQEIERTVKEIFLYAVT